eukprot:TRINITY_DN66447_c0_g1_i1.p1 TRINITY_DN66447_c0_g1~~TRINITY_DN66447_c0_g1_i1.p1  ORF type:complete len:240 (-),score=32.47 TRINITY_DN66447_c0_g1_i1:14-733(-)
MSSDEPCLIDELYLLSLCSSIACASMGVILALAGINMATECRKEMLVKLMRLPIRDILGQVEDQAHAELAESFEQQGVSQVMRVPFFDQVKEQISPSTSERISKETSMSDDANGQASGLEQAEHTRIIAALDRQNRIVQETFEQKEREWSSLERTTGNFLFLALSYLLNAFSALVASEWHSKRNHAYILSSAFFMVMQATVVYIANLRYYASRLQTYFEICMVFLQIPLVWAFLPVPSV